MEITWLGTAGFQIRTKSSGFLLDPYLSRNKQANPCQPFTRADLEGDRIFLSHGHFDHIQDVPMIAGFLKSRIFCSDGAAKTLNRMGVPDSRIERVTRSPFRMDAGDFSATAFFSRHVRYDRQLLMDTLLKINISIFKYLPLMMYYPCGQVLSWRFDIERKRIHFFGTAGSNLTELNDLAKEPVDILLVPLQGHTQICDIALKYVEVLKPDLVIPCHQDDFFPPISRQVDITPFLEGVKKANAGTRVEVLEMNQSLQV